MQIASYDEPELKLCHDWGQISGGSFTEEPLFSGLKSRKLKILFSQNSLISMNYVGPWSGISTTDCYFNDPGSIPISTCWEVTMLRLSDYGPFGNTVSGSS